MPATILKLQKPGTRVPKAGIIAQLKSGCSIALDPSGRGFIIASKHEAPFFIFWDGTQEILKLNGDVYEMPAQDLRSATTPEDFSKPNFPLPNPLPRGIIEIIDDELPEASVAKSMAVSSTPTNSPVLHNERIPTSEFAWFDVTLFDNQIMTIVEAKCIYSMSKEIPHDPSVKAGRVNSIIGMVMEKVKAALGKKA